MIMHRYWLLCGVHAGCTDRHASNYKGGWMNRQIDRPDGQKDKADLSFSLGLISCLLGTNQLTLALALVFELMLESAHKANKEVSCQVSRQVCFGAALLASRAWGISRTECCDNAALTAEQSAICYMHCKQ